jgi:hypothetical protein
MTVADVSTTLLTGSVIVYTLAMIAHAVEWSSARSSRPAAAPVLVAAAPSPDVRRWQRERERES